MTILTLTVVDPARSARGAGSRAEFRETDGTIGRLPENDLVLDHPNVSREHARIRYENGSYSVEDRSSNGIWINGHDNRLARGERYPLQPGDRMLIEPFEILVSIERDDVSDPFALEADERAAPRPLDPFVGPGGAAHLADPQSVVDPLALIDAPPPAAPPRPGRLPSRASASGGSMFDEAFQPPAPVAPPPPADFPEIPTHWDKSIIAPSPVKAPPAAAPRPEPAPRPAAQAPTPATRGDGTLADVLAGAGLEGVAVTPELARNFGLILRVVVSGMVDVLKARQELKSEFRIRGTTVMPVDNNPLKFSVNFEDALHNLLAKRNPAYLGPVEAFEDAFEDVRHHQIAMLEGVRKAFEAMLAEFDPDRLQQDFDRQMKRGALLAAPSKMRYWDLYREWFHDMVRDAETSFRELFGDEFARAYERQLEQLKAKRRAGKR